MKKVIVLATIFTLLGGVSVYGATKVKEIKAMEFSAQITNTAKGNLFIYEVPMASSTCYVMVSDEVKYGISPTMSCVKK